MIVRNCMFDCTIWQCTSSNSTCHALIFYIINLPCGEAAETGRLNNNSRRNTTESRQTVKDDIPNDVSVA